MAKNLKLANASVNAEMNALGALFDSGKLQIYDGSQPTDADTAVGAQVKLAEFSLPADCFGSASAGVITANAITDTTGITDGTAAWFRALQSDGSKILDGTVGVTSGQFDCVINSTGISTGATVSVVSWTITLPKSA